jgi:hypothetical protein
METGSLMPFQAQQIPSSLRHSAGVAGGRGGCAENQGSRPKTVQEASLPLSFPPSLPPCHTSSTLLLISQPVAAVMETGNAAHLESGRTGSQAPAAFWRRARASVFSSMDRGR